MRRTALILGTLLLSAALLTGCSLARGPGCFMSKTSARGGQLERAQDLNHMFGASSPASLGGW